MITIIFFLFLLLLLLCISLFDNEVCYTFFSVLDTLLPLIPPIASAIAAGVSAYVAYKNRKELKLYQAAEKKYKKQKELADKYKTVILDRKLDVIENFYRNCSDLLDDFYEYTDKEPSIYVCIQRFLSNYSLQTLMFSKHFTIFVKAIDTKLGQSIEDILIKYQDKIIITFDEAFSTDSDDVYRSKQDIEKCKKLVQKILDDQHTEIITIIVSYTP